MKSALRPGLEYAPHFVYIDLVFSFSRFTACPSSHTPSGKCIFGKQKRDFNGILKKSIGNKDEPDGEFFIPTPTHDIPGLEPIIVQAIENLYPDT